MKKINFRTFLKKLSNSLKGKKFDAVIGIGRGGSVPSAFAAQTLVVPFGTVCYSFYGEGMPPARIHEMPIKKSPISIRVRGKNILLVDDVCRSGQTLAKAKKALKKAGAKSVKTLVVAGSRKADIVLFPSKECLKMPWCS